MSHFRRSISAPWHAIARSKSLQPLYLFIVDHHHTAQASPPPFTAAQSPVTERLSSLEESVLYGDEKGIDATTSSLDSHGDSSITTTTAAVVAIEHQQVDCGGVSVQQIPASSPLTRAVSEESLVDYLVVSAWNRDNMAAALTDLDEQAFDSGTLFLH